jgi:CRP-like cAMP-binding protein
MFLDDLNQSDLEQLESIGQLTDYTAGEEVVREGGAGSFFGIIIEGELEVFKRFEDGEKHPLVKLGPADLIGEVGFLGAPSRTASVVASEPSRILVFERNRFEQWVEDIPWLGVKVYRGMAEELAGRLAAVDASYTAAMNRSRREANPAHAAPVDEKEPAPASGTNRMLKMIRSRESGC